MIGIYVRINRRVLFLLPCIAVGIDVDGRYFFELGIFCWAIGIGTE